MTPDQNRRYYASKLEIKGSRPAILTRCPFHEDRVASLSVNLDTGLWYCHACCVGGSPVEFEMRSAGVNRLEARKLVNAALGITDYDYSGEPEAIYEYRDELGQPLFRKLRYFGKKFKIERREENQWLDGIGSARHVLYNLPKLLTSNHIFITEGEKDADRIESLSLARLDPSGFSKCCAVCNFDGAGKWLAEYSRYFAGKQIAVLYDNDPPGLAHGKMVAESVSAFAAQTKLINLPELAPHGDVSDFLDKFTPADLLAVIQTTPAFAQSQRAILVPAEEFNRLYSPAVDWLVEGVIQRHANGFFAAEPKGGKSWAVEYMALCLATGRPWLGRTVNSCRVALISREDNPGLTRWRLHALAKGMNIDISTIYNLWINTREQSAYFSLDDPATAAEMIAALRAAKTELAIFDVLNVLHHADENDNTEMRAVLESLSAIQSAVGCSVCVCHHFNKLTEGSLIKRLRGSSAISGWAEYLIGIDSPQEGVRRMQFEIKAATPLDPIYFTIASQDNTAWITECQRPKEAKGKAGKVLQ